MSEIVLQYVGADSKPKRHVQGLPARDLTEDDIAGMARDFQSDPDAVVEQLLAWQGVWVRPGETNHETPVAPEPDPTTEVTTTETSFPGEAANKSGEVALESPPRRRREK